MQAQTEQGHRVVACQTAMARTDLANLQHAIVQAKTLQGEGLHIEDLIEANQHLVLAMLAMQSQTSLPGDQPHSNLLTGAEHLARQHQDIREANEQLVISSLKAQDLQAKAELGFAHQKSALTTVAHELRNPLTPISLIADRLVRAPTADLPRMQAMLQGQVKHMARLIEDLLDVSRATARFAVVGTR